MRQKIYTFVLLIATALLLLIVLPNCSGGNGSATPADQTPSPTITSAAPIPIVTPPSIEPIGSLIYSNANLYQVTFQERAFNTLLHPSEENPSNYFNTAGPCGGFIYFLLSNPVAQTSDIYRMKPDSGEMEQLTFGNKQSLFRLSLDCQSMVYAFGVGGSEMSPNIVEYLDLETGISETLFTESVNSVYTYSLAWSPNNDLVAYTLIDDWDTGHISLFLLRPGGPAPQEVILNGTLLSMQPGWSPDGAMLAIGLQTDQSVDIHLVNIETEATERLLHVDGIPDEFIWSPDGKYLLYTVWLNTTSQYLDRLNLLSLETHQTTTIQNGDSPRGGYRAVWSPDGRDLAYFTGTRLGEYRLHVFRPENDGHFEMDLYDIPDSNATWTNP